MFLLFQRFVDLFSTPRFVQGKNITLDFSFGEITAIGRRPFLFAGQIIQVGDRRFRILQIEYYSTPSDMFHAVLEESREIAQNG